MAIPPVISSCGGGAAIPAPVAGGAVTETVKFAGKKLGELLIEFLVTSGFQAISSNYDNRLQSLSGADAANVSEIQAALKDGGFYNFKMPVYQGRVSGSKITVYGAEKNDGEHLCAPCYSGTAMGVPMIEAPVIIAVTYASREWNVRGVSTAEGLLPVKVISQDPCNLRRNTSRPLKYETQAGTLETAYRAPTGRQPGTVSLVAKRRNGGVLFGGDYDVKLT